jgi:type IV pilus assembly protein PilQ
MGNVKGDFMRRRVLIGKAGSASRRPSIIALAAILLFASIFVGNAGFSQMTDEEPVTAEEDTLAAAEEDTTMAPEEQEPMILIESPPPHQDFLTGEVLISNMFYESDLREALRDVSIQAGVSIITDETVGGFVTMEIVDLPLEETLRRLLAPGGFTFKKMDGYYLVGAPYPDNPSFALLTVTERIRPNYLKAMEVPALVSDFYKPFLKVDNATNILVISASPEIISRLKEDLAEIDVPPIQVMIEALVTEFSSDLMRNIGIDWRVIGRGPDYAFSLVSLLTGLADSSFVLSVTSPDQKTGKLTYDLTSTIHALSETGQVKIHANPRVATLDGRSAAIFLGAEEYYEIITGPVTYPYTRLEMIKSGITLKVTPFVANNGDITVEIEPEVSDVVGKGSTNLPIVTKRSVVTQVRVKDGQTIAIGGLVQKSERKSAVKIPILGDIPILGYLFSYHTPQVAEKEVWVFITPHILKDGER